MSSNSTTTNLNSAENTEQMNQDYKEKLDRAAHEARHPHRSDEQEKPDVHPIVEKVTEYVPPLGRALGLDKKSTSQEQTAPAKPPGPPERPQHDTQVKEFLRDQHRSMPIDQDLE